ncbi:MAG: gamma-glutamylcyclotransferase, partial [Pseudomonadota bacterium]|nr:gamma-glutamylcyclotransferase [Pseudomonadota bacterium]
GDAPLADIAQQIAQAHGPSGPNSAYLLNLAQALRELGTEDAHIFALEAQLQRYQ